MTQRFRYIGTSSEALIVMRQRGIHISTIVLLGIIQHCTTASLKYAYIAEIEAYFNQILRERKLTGKYTYGGINSMLRKMHKQGFISRTKDGRYVGYRLTGSGINILDSIGATQ